MPVLGADPDALRELGIALRRAADQLDLQSAGLERRFRATGWRGPDAERFERDWQVRHRTWLRAVADSCRASATTLVRQAGEQDRASSGTAAIGFTSAGGSVFPILGPAQNAGSSSQSDSRLDAGRPTSELRAHVGAEVVVDDVLGSGGHDLSIQQLPGDRARVTVSNTQRVGVAAIAGTALTVGGTTPVLGAAAEGQATVGWVTRQSYLVDSDDAVPAAIRADAQLQVSTGLWAAEHTAGIGIGVRATHAAADWLLERVGVGGGLGGLADRSGLTMPTERTENLLEIQIQGGAAVAAGSAIGIHGAIASEGVARFGIAELADGSTSKVIEVEGTAASTINGTLLGRLELQPHGILGDHLATGSLRLEIPDDGLGSEALLTMTSSDGLTEHQAVFIVDLSDRANIINGHVSAQVISDMTHGRVDDALEGLANLHLPTGSELVSRSAMAISDHHGQLGAVFGDGVGAALTAGADVQQLSQIGGSGG